MQDQITRLCRRLLSSEDPAELRLVARQLQNAIRERIDQIREDAIGIAIIHRVVDLDAMTRMYVKEGTDSARQSGEQARV